MSLRSSSYWSLSYFIIASSAWGMMDPDDDKAKKELSVVITPSITYPVVQSSNGQPEKKRIAKGLLSNSKDIAIAIPPQYAGEPFEQKVPSQNFATSPTSTEEKKAKPLDTAHIYERVMNNIYGHHVLLKPELLGDHLDFFSVFEALAKTLSVKTVKCENISFDTVKVLNLASSLTRNTSLKRLDLSAASLPMDALTILSYGLQAQKHLRELIVPFQMDFNEQQMDAFYNLIKDNKALRIIVWPKDDKFFKKMRIISDGKNRAAILHRGVMFAEGLYETRDTEKALTYLQKAHDLGHPLASYEIGQLKEKQGAYQDALTWYIQAADQGHPTALTKVGDYYRGIWPKNGFPITFNPSQKTKQTPNYIENPDYREAYNKYNQAARLGYGKALYRVGRMYEAGRFVEKDLSKAATYFYESLQRGYAEGATAIGGLHNNPDYKDRDPESAKYYLEWAKRFQKTKGTAERLLKVKPFQEEKKK